MESNEDLTSAQLRESLRTAERGELSGWTEHVPSRSEPWIAGLWAGSLAFGLAYLDGTLGTVWSLAHVAGAFLWAGLSMWRRSPYPRSRAPREYHRPTWLMMLGAVVVPLLAWAAGALVAGWVAVVVAGLGWGGVCAAYNRRYVAVSAQVRERLA